MPSAGKPLSLTTLRRLVQQVGATVAALGEDLAAAQPSLQRRQVHRKGRGDFVTTFDRQVERTLRRELLAALPEAGFLGEEGAPLRAAAELLWVVDPIDGTSNFAKGLPQFAVAVALLQRGLPRLAVIWNRADRCLYTAVRGQGASCAGRRIHCRGGSVGDDALLGCQWRPGDVDLQLLVRLQRRGARLRSYGCTVGQVLDVAMGRLDANVQPQGHVWDFAAPALVLLEAGGCFSDWRGRPVFPLPAADSRHFATLACAPLVHRRLIGWLRELPAPLVVSSR